MNNTIAWFKSFVRVFVLQCLSWIVNMLMETLLRPSFYLNESKTVTFHTENMLWEKPFYCTFCIMQQMKIKARSHTDINVTSTVLYISAIVWQCRDVNMTFNVTVNSEAKIDIHAKVKCECEASISDISYI